MADWYGTARTNYVRIIPSAHSRVRDLARLFQMRISEDTEGRWAFFPDGTEFGDFEEFAYPKDPSDSDKAILDSLGYYDLDNQDAQWDWNFIAQHMPDKEVLIVVTGGAEKQRYITYGEVAYTNEGEIARFESGEVLRRIKELGLTATQPWY